MTENAQPNDIAGRVEIVPPQQDAIAFSAAPRAEDSVDAVLQQNALIDELIKKAMKKDQHYGVIPGTGAKPSLLKPGAEALARLFRLAPRYRVTETPLGDDHFKLDIVCELYHRVTGEFWGEGVATASTKESKYRWRYEDVATGKPVPKEYWANRDKALLGGAGYSAKKVDGNWEIVERGEKVENPDIADQWNTVKKMGKKRAFADAILTATGASAVFTQDVEDMEASKAALDKEAPQNTATERPQPQEGASSPDWDGELIMKTGKYKGSKWSDIPVDWLMWVVDNKKGPVDLAVKEIARRSLEEGNSAHSADTEIPFVEGEVVDDDELQERFK